MDFPVVSQDLLCADRGGNDIIIMLSWKFQVMALYSNRVHVIFISFSSLSFSLFNNMKGS
jgi:hypothetical protein